MTREVSIDAGVNALLEQRALFRAFLRRRLNNDAEVDDLLQHALVKAMQRRDSVREGEKIVAWFYRLLRHTVIDHHRSESAHRRRDDLWAQERAPDQASSATLCACLGSLLPTLDSRAADLVRRVDLEGEPVARVAGERTSIRCNSWPRSWISCTVICPTSSSGSPALFHAFMPPTR